jgi:hypothetical protein
MFAGLIPLVVLVWLAVTIGPAFEQPAFLESIWQAAAQVLAMASTVLRAAWAGAGGLGEAIGLRPDIVGWLMIMAGIVFLWGGVYSRLTGRRVMETR